MKILKRLPALLLALLLCFGTVAGAVTAHASTTYYIRSAEDLEELADKCTLDTYSRGISVLLTTDIDLSDSDFETIPTFGGSFDGQGHTISGFSVTGNGSYVGLFRYIQEGAEVKGLTLSCTVAPSGSGAHVGGLCGSNSGTITGCTVNGTVRGINTVGGVAGANEETGVISASRMFGFVYGEHYVGGIAGQNLGLISNSSSSASVNTTVEEISVDAGELNLEQLNSTENLEEYTDLGGIAGFSSGVIQRCTNSGTVGYEHVGYNVGGIAGRQSGFVTGCTNNGAVIGRKDVGGVVGQMEPYLVLDLNAATAANLKTELNKLHDLLSKALNDAQSSTTTITTRLNSVNGYMYGASDDLGYIADKTVEFVDTNIGQLNDLAARVDYAMDNLPAVLDDLSAATTSASLAMEAFRKVNEDLAIVSKMENHTFVETDYRTLTVTTGTGGYIYVDNPDPGAGQTVTLTVTPDAGYQLGSIAAWDADEASVPLTGTGDTYTFVMPTESGDPVNDPVNAIAKNVVVRANFVLADEYWAVTGNTLAVTTGYGGTVTASDPKALPGAEVSLTVRCNEGYKLNSLTAVDDNGEPVALAKVDNAGTTYKLTMPAVGVCLVSATFARQSDWQVVETAADEISRQSAEFQTAVDAAQRDYDALMQAMGMVYNASTERWEPPANGIDWNDLDQDQMTTLGSALINDLLDAADAAAGVISAANTLGQVLMPYVSEAARQANIDLDIALSHMQDASNSLTSAVSATRDILSYLNGLPDIQFVPLGSEYRVRMDSLCGNLKSMSTELAALNKEMASAGTLLISDMKLVNDQFNVVMIMLVEAIDGIANPTGTDIITDNSDADDDTKTEGKVRACVNMGRVTSDKNAGGIAGDMGIEYDFDPESDVTGGTSNATSAYISRCVMKDCENTGIVTVKNDAAGSVVGMMELGSVIGCRGFGPVTSESGDYVGGIAGQSASVIRSSWAMCALTGDDFVGGIAGLGAKVYDCRSLVSVTGGDECVGAVAGSLDTAGEIKGNLFVSDTLKGVDGISYTDKAQSVSFQRLLSLPDIPDEFTNMSVTFVADGRVIKSIGFTYGESIDPSQIPAVPERSGYSGSWPEFDYSHLTFSQVLEAEYLSLNTTIACAETRQGGTLPLVLVEGNFHPGATVSAAASEEGYPQTAYNQKILEILEVEVDDNGDEDDAHLVHYLMPENAGRLTSVAVYLKDSDGWHRAQHTSAGRYLLFEGKGNDFVICAVEQPVDNAWYIVGAGALLVGLAVYLISRGRSGRGGAKPRKARRAKKRADDAELADSGDTETVDVTE